jgi:hypothetical protein
MKRRSILAVAFAWPLLGAVAVASAQSTKDVAGVYSGVSFVNTDAAGNTTQTFGDNPRAMMVLTPDGRYSIVVMRGDLPKFGSASRLKGTPEENRAVVQGSISHFGRYTVDDKDQSITFHVEASTFANWDGQPQKRPFTLKGDELSYRVPAPSVGSGTSVVTWKRIGPAM